MSFLIPESSDMAGEAISSIFATEGILSERLAPCQGRGGSGSEELEVHGRGGDGVGPVGYNTVGAETEAGCWLSRRAEPWARVGFVVVGEAGLERVWMRNHDCTKYGETRSSQSVLQNQTVMSYCIKIYGYARRG